MIDLSIIIIDYNASAYLLACLQSLKKNLSNISYEVIVVDNASTVSHIEDYRKIIPKLIALHSPTNRGFGAGNNLGAKQAKGKYILFLNNDTIVQKDALEKLIDVLCDEPTIGIVGPRLVTDEQIEERDYYGDFPNLFNLITGRKNKFNAPEDNLIYCQRLSGACLVIRRELFSRLGGFDENFFMYFEDTDLCLRTKKAGFKVALVTDAIIIHKGGKSRTSRANQKQQYGQSQAYFFRKHYSLATSTLLIIVRFIYKKFSPEK